MKKFLLTAAVLALCLLLPAAALADVTVIREVVAEYSPTPASLTNCYVQRVEGGYYVFNADNQAISASYKSITVRENGMYYEVANANGLNNLGMLDKDGQLVLSTSYGDLWFVNEDWVLAYVLEAVTTDTSDYKDSNGNRYNVCRTDVVYKGKIIGSLTRNDYTPSYSTGAKGAFLYVKQTSGQGYWLDANFNRVDVTENFSTTEFTEVYKKGVFHNPTQQYAFVPSCTLTTDQVERPVWYDDNTGCILDLQGNVLASGVISEYTYWYGGDYLVTRTDSGYGVITFDGKQLIPNQYDNIPYDSISGLFANGYQAVLDEAGRLAYYNLQGEKILQMDYELSVSDYKGVYDNAPIVAVKNMGKYMIISATHGQLDDMYDDVLSVKSTQHVMAVKKGESWGVIDMAGNIVIPFDLRISPTFSRDGSMVFGYTNDRVNVIYYLSGSGAAVQEEPAQQEQAAQPAEPAAEGTGSWVCPECQNTNTGKFCVSCGAAKPAEPVDENAWTCPTCSRANTGKFCPECGTAKPAATEPQCANCGWKPEGDAPKFCPECGTRF